ncbi:MAG TPA: anhydro-N-acetylmuramic acid kinase [Bryobacteraceae bacterium]|nr:anhydro-N-acetylmuramic acid kinase [Bryobacteraceae bacterium]
MRVAGVMSGTSLDGVDVAVIDIEDRSVQTLAFGTTPYTAAMRRAILDVSDAHTTTASISRLSFQLGELYARAVIATCRKADLDLGGIHLIGCHGQTIYHESGRNTLQIGEAAVLAERTGVPVVSDFRTRDIAAGGKGAPLVPFVDALLFREPSRNRVALNIGGIANVTLLPKKGPVVAFDTGPGNMVIDALVSRHTGGKRKFDRGGRIAASGRVNDKLLAKLVQDPYYRLRPPKSAGREQYGKDFVRRLLRSGISLPDLIATATILTAVTIAAAIHRFAPGCDDLIVSGGGAHNRQIMGHLSALLPDAAIATSADYGIHVDAKEAVAFAILASRTWRRRPSNVPSATGARRPVILGKVSY